MAEEHGECIATELGLGRGEKAAFFEDSGLGMTEEMVQLEVVDVVHVEEIAAFFSRFAFGPAGVDDEHLDERDAIFLLKGTFFISFATDVDVVQIEVLDDVHVELLDQVHGEEVIGTLPFIDFGLDDTIPELFGTSFIAINFSVVLVVQVALLDSVVDSVQNEDLGVFDAGIFITDALRGTETSVNG